MSPTVSDFIVRVLKETGVDAVFGLPGVHALGLWNALTDSGLRYVGFRHEQAAAHAADGYGRATGRPGVVLLSTGPGALNAASALGEAMVSSSPVLALASAIPSNLIGKGRGYLHEAKDLLPAFESVTRFSGRATSSDEVPALLTRALEAVLGGRPGPAMVEIPVDLLDASLEASADIPLPDRLPPDEGQIDEALGVLRLAARPVIWAGGGVLRSAATPELTTVAETLGAPVITTFMGKGAFPEDHPLAVGTMVRQPEAADLIREADAMLAVGTRFTGMATGNWQLEMPAQLVHLDLDSEVIGRNYPARCEIVADAREGLRALAGGLEGRQPAQEHWRARAAEVRRACIERARREGPREMAILDAIRAALDPSIVTVHDMTIPSYWSWPFFPVTEAGTFHSPYGYGSLGFSVPASIGVAASDPGRPVVAFSGDGGFQYHGRELATVAQYSLPVTVIVFNDQSWGVLRAFSRARYAHEFGMDIPAPDFPALAAAYGVSSARVTEPEDLEKALREAVGSSGPYLIEVPGPWSLPPPAGYYR